MNKNIKKLLVLLLAVTVCFSSVSSVDARGFFGNWLSGLFGNRDTTTETSSVEESTENNVNSLESSTSTTNDTGTSEVKYLPVTMFNYDQEKYNDILKAKENPSGNLEDIDQWKGIYMGNDSDDEYTYRGEITYGGPEHNYIYYEKVTDPITNNRLNLDANATYVLVNASQGADGSTSNGIYVGVGISNSGVISVRNNQIGNYANPIEGIAEWTITRDQDNWSNKYRFENNGKYLNIGNNVSMGSSQYLTVSEFSNDSSRIMIGNGSTYMNKYGGYTHGIGTTFGVYSEKNDEGSSFYLYKVVTGEKIETAELTKTVSYANYNKWTGQLSGRDGIVKGNRIYQGLVKNELDANGQIQFNYPDAGLFTSEEFDNGAKKVYTKVGLPFEYNQSKQEYWFNAKEMGAWFEGGAESDKNLTYSAIPQARIGDQQDTNVAGWFPFNDSTNTAMKEDCKAPGLEDSVPVDAKPVENPDYYFGMAATFNFTMSPNGRLQNDTREKIVFDFSGDDDVWVFVDGKLVLDLGGIHNRIDGNINFADGTWSIKPTYHAGEDDLAEDLSSNSSANSSGILWEKLGINSIADFAAVEDHTLTIFYLERGAGASNCEIKFNMPMKDYVNVTKKATKAITTDSVLTNLTDEQQNMVNAWDFKFVISRNGAPYANRVYTVLDAGNQTYKRTATTNAQGQFVLRNGETAQFGTVFSSNKEAWQIEEIDPGGDVFTNPRWDAVVKGNQNHTYPSVSTEFWQSQWVEVVGNTAVPSRIDFECENFLSVDFLNPGVKPDDDDIVIDYGLPVKIDVKNGDMFSGNNSTYKIIGIKTDKEEISDVKENVFYETSFGKVKIIDAKSGLLEYRLNKQLTDVDQIEYTVEIEGSGDAKDEKATGSGKVNIIPATSMYYEENFTDVNNKEMITYKNPNDWKNILDNNFMSEYQEDGINIPGKDDNGNLIKESPYGSDIAYLNDSGDSNGTSKYINTADINAASAFKYTFTGTGTSFFVRTSNTSAYLRVTVKDSGGNLVEQKIIDTRFLNENGQMLYNIPVYTKDNLEYGTYTISVSISKKVLNYGTEFWLDGIRVQNPMNPKSTKKDIAQTAYSNDGEANVNIATLRDKLIDASKNENGELVWEEGFAVLTDVENNIISASDYASIGPKQEVYLAGSDFISGSNAQKISFVLKDWDKDEHRLYLGIKAPMNLEGSSVIDINNKKQININNATDCYYDITEWIIMEDVTNEEGAVIGKNARIELTAVKGLISITNIKTTGTKEFVVIPKENIDKISEAEV